MKQTLKTAAALVAVLASMASLSSCGASSHVADEVVDDNVNVGYGSVKKDDLTYSVSSVKMNETETSQYSNMYDYLRGKVPGVYIDQGNKILIRGISSINSSTDPLILMDGVEIGDLDLVNPYDVYSVDVLKDASSSIYGVRGANGVILITSKGAHMAKEQEIQRKKDEKAAKKAARAAKKKNMQVDVNVSTRVY